MKSITHSKKTLYILTITTCLLLVGGLFFTLTKINEILQNKHFFYGSGNNLSTGITHAKYTQDYFQTKTIINKLEQKKYFEALQNIKEERSIDYYNRGTIYLIRAFQESLEGSLTSLETSQNLINKAYNNYNTAKKLQLNKEIDNIIEKNKNITSKLKTLINQKSCFSNNQEVIISLNDINNTIKNNKQGLINTLKVIQKNKERITENGGVECYKTTEKQTENNINILRNLYSQIWTQENNQSKEFINIIKNKEECDFFPNDSFRNNITQTKEKLKTLNINTTTQLNIITNKNISELELLCENEKHDGEINQTDNNIKELLEQIENISDKQEYNEQTEENKISNQPIKNTTNENYLLNEKTIQQSIWIKNMLDIKSQKNYNTQDYIEELFKVFYGNSEEFN